MVSISSLLQNNNMEYVATFYSHFGAIQFEQFCKQRGITVHLQPVPRWLSSSCGTCAIFQVDRCIVEDIPEDILEDIEQVVEKQTEGYREIYKSN